MSELELRDAILRHALQLQRLSAGEQRQAEAILRELEAELKALLNSQTLSEADKRTIEALINKAEDAINPAYAKLASSVDTHSLALIVAEKTVAAIEDIAPVAINAPTAARLASLTKDVLIEGSPLSEWWKAQADDLSMKFAAQVRQGVIAGETNEKIVRRIVGSRTETGLMDIARRHARTLVHSSVQAAANEARLATFRKNAHIFSAVRWISTLDSHTCLRCGALDGKQWNLDGDPMKGTTVSFVAPPLHASCRCVLTGVVSGFEGARKGATRASSEGPVDATTTFEDFLKRQSDSFVERTLGKSRAELFLAGKLTLRDLISGSGRELTLDELGTHI